MLLRCTAVLALLAGCPDSDELPECTGIGQNDVMLVASDPDPSVGIVDIEDGSTVSLMSAPQGGHIVLVGAAVRATGDCQLAATASLRDPVTQRVIGLEQRPLLLERGTNGWAKPQGGLSAMPNVAVCPSAVTTMIDGKDFLLEVALATLDGDPLVTVSAMVKLACADNYCRSDCGN